jgi:hypothetical protein
MIVSWNRATWRPVVWLTLAGGAILVAGVSAGAYWGERRASSRLLERATVAGVQLKLRAANVDLTILYSIVDGHPERAYKFAEAMVLDGYTMTRLPGLPCPDKSGPAGLSCSELQAAVVSFYRTHPEQRAALAARYPAMRELVEAVGGE